MKLGLARSRPTAALFGVMLGAALAGGVSFAVAQTSSSSDMYYACVGTTGTALNKIRPATMRLNVPPVKCPYATDVVRSWNAAGPIGPEGPRGADGAVRDVAIAYGDERYATGIAWPDYSSLPGARLEFTVPEASLERIIVRFGAEADCTGSVDGDGDMCVARITVDGVPALPAPEPDFYWFVTDDPGVGGVSASLERTAVLGPGVHVVEAQFGVRDVGVADTPEFGIDDWIMTVTRLDA